MDHEQQFYYKPQPAPHKPDRRLLVIVGLVVAIMIVGLLAFIFQLVNKAENTADANIPDPGYKLTETALTKSLNFSEVIGNELYSYNGLAFYKTSLDKEGKVTILRSGLKLPTPRTIVWGGSSGVLISFDGAYSGSIVYDLMRGTGSLPNKATNDYVWYLDFATGAIKLVATVPMVEQTAVYSETDKTFYFVSQPSSGDITDHHLLFLDTKNSSGGTVVRTKMNTVSSMSLCSGYKVCFEGRDTTNIDREKLFAVTNENKLTMIYDSGGRLFATNKPDLYVAVKDTDTSNARQRDTNTADNIKFDGPDDTDYPPAPATLYNIKDKSSRELGFEVAQPNVVLNFTSDSDFYAFDQSYEVVDEAKNLRSYRAGILNEGAPASSKLFLLKLGDKPFEGLAVSVGQGGTNNVISDELGRSLLFSNSQSLPDLTAAQQTSARKIIDSCSATAKVDTYYPDTKTYRIETTYDANFQRNIATFSSCVAQKGSTALTGYNYSFVGRDPGNGRLATD